VRDGKFVFPISNPPSDLINDGQSLAPLLSGNPFNLAELEVEGFAEPLAEEVEGEDDLILALILPWRPR
jgi:hypothetical protein